MKATTTYIINPFNTKDMKHFYSGTGKYIYILAFLFASVFGVGNVMGQGAFTSTWALTAAAAAGSPGYVPTMGGAASTTATGSTEALATGITATYASSAQKLVSSSPDWLTYGSTSVATGQYAEFTVAPSNSTYAISAISTVTAYLGRGSSSESTSVTVWYSIDGGTTWTQFTGTTISMASSTPIQNTFTLSLTGLSIQSTSSFKFRVLPYYTASSSGKTIKIDNVVISGTTSSACIAPSITTQPSTTAQTLCVGATATALSVVTSASSPTYRWYTSAAGNTTDTTFITGATSASYTPLTTTASTYYYLCKVTSSSCSTMSAASGLITVNALPTVSSVTGGTICVSGTTTLTATPSTGTIDWYAASTLGTALTTGATSYTTPTISATTSYYAQARNTTTGCVSAARTAATATVAAGGVAGTASASPTAICSGSSSTLTLTGNTGSIQWQSCATSGGTYTDISGATSATLSVSPTSTTYYRAAVTLGTCSTVYTSYVTVTVSSLTITQSTAAQTLCAGSTATAMTATATGATTWQWYSNGTASNTGGTIVSTGTGYATSSFTPSTATAGTTYYYCVVGNGTCSVSSAVSGAILINATTAISTQPSGASVVVGGTATLTVAATGAGTLTYAWYSNSSASNSGGSAISGATSASYSAPTTTAGTYYYYCVVTGTCSTVTSNAVTVTVTSSAAAEINVQQAGTDYLTGSTYAFGSANIGTYTNKVFSIQNTGSAKLYVSAIALTSATGFTLTASADTIYAGTTGTFVVRFAPTAASSYTGGYVTITNTDGDEGSYKIYLTGTGTAVSPAVPTGVNVTDTTNVGFKVNWTATASPTTGYYVKVCTVDLTSTYFNETLSSWNTFPAGTTSALINTFSVDHNLATTQSPTGCTCNGSFLIQNAVKASDGTFLEMGKASASRVTHPGGAYWEGGSTNSDGGILTFPLVASAGTLTLGVSSNGSNTATYTIEKSIDGGVTFTTVSTAGTITGSTNTPATYSINEPSPVILRIRATASKFLRIYSIKLTNYVTCATPVYVSGIATNNYTYTTLSANTPYYYSVASYDGTNTSDYSKLTSSTIATTLKNSYLLTKSVNNASYGTLTASPTPDAVSGTKYYDGDVITLTATPAAGYRLSSWTVDGTVTASTGYGAKTNSITISGANRTVVATFVAVPQYAVTTSVNNASFGSITATASYYEGSDVTITATPGALYRLKNWVIDGTTTTKTGNTYTFTAITAAHTIQAVFELTPPQELLTVTIEPSAGGTVTANGVAVTSGASVSYDYGTAIALSATPAAGYAFLRWVTPSGRFTDNPYNIEMTDNIPVTAKFAPSTCTTYTFDAWTSTNLSTGSDVTVSTVVGGLTWNTITSRLNTSTSYSFGSTGNSIRLPYSNGALITPVMERPNLIGFAARMSSTTVTGTVKVYISEDGGTTYNATPVLTATIATGGAYQTFSTAVTTTSTTVRFKIVNETGNGSTSYNVYLDNVQLCGAPDNIPPVITIDPANGTTGVLTSKIITITSDELLYKYIGATQVFSPLTSADIASYVTLTDVTTGLAKAFTGTIDGTGKIITITPTTALDYTHQYTVTISNVSDANENLIPSAISSTFTVRGLPNPEINVMESATRVDYPTGSSYSMGTLIGGTTIVKTFKVYNTGSDPLLISSATVTGAPFTITAPAASVAGGDTTTITVTFTPSATGIFKDSLTINSNDGDEAAYKIYLDGIKAAFVIPYTYESGCTSPIVTTAELKHDYSSLLDIPSQIKIGTFSSSSAVTAANFFADYKVFHVEGNCMPDGNSTLRVGAESDNKSLLLDLPSCGMLSFKWCASGYRKVKVTDSNGKVYLQSPTYLKGSVCYTNNIVVNTCSAIKIEISFEGPSAGTLTSLYNLSITPCSATLKNNAKDITDFSFGITDENVRIYDNYIFVTLPAGNTLSSSLLPTILKVSADATIKIKTTGDNYSDGSVTYTVTAQDGTTKDYTVSVEVATTHSGYYENAISVTVPMNKKDQLLSVLEIANSSCIVPSSGDGSDYTIFFLDQTDKPVSGYKIAGLTQLCVGSTASYTLSNAPNSNNPTYKWKLDGADASKFTVVSDSTSPILTIKAPNEITGTVALKLKIVVDFSASTCQWVTGADSINISVTKDAPTTITNITGGCLSNGYLTLTAHGASNSATSYNWIFTPSSTAVISQADSSIVLNIGTSINNITATVNTQNGCGIKLDTNTYPVDYATATTTWTGAVSGDWNDNGNWTARVPKACTNVIIPDVSNATGVYYPIIATATKGLCNNITFKPGAGVLGLDSLHYSKAYIQTTLSRNKWYTLTAPLKNMYSGDYAFTGAPVTTMRLFDTFNPDTISGGHLYNGTWTKAFNNLAVSLTKGRAFATNISKTTWNYPNGKTTVSTDFTLTFPRMNADSSLVTTYIPFSSMNGYPYIQLAKTVAKTDSAYRFISENAAGKISSNLAVPLETGLNLVGNPLMTHLDFTKLYTNNSSVIDNLARFWNGTSFVTYNASTGIWSDVSYTGSLIAPMQSFVVNNTTAASGTLNFAVSGASSVFVANAKTASNKLRSAKTADDNLLYITSNNGIATSSTAIAQRDNASNKYGKDDAFKLFTSVAEVPDVYTLASGYALDINEFNKLPYTTPVGIKTTQKGNVTLKFNGAESFTDATVTLINTANGDSINLKEQSTYEYTLDSTNAEGVLFVQFRNATITDNSLTSNNESDIQIFTKDNNVIRAISSPQNPIEEVAVMDETGKTVLLTKGLNTSLYDTVMNNGKRIYLVRVVTEKEVKVAKVLIK